MPEITLSPMLTAVAPYVYLAWGLAGLGFVGLALYKGWLWLDPKPVTDAKTFRELQKQIERGEITIDEIESRVERSEHV